jgi:thioredoxin-related protein
MRGVGNLASYAEFLRAARFQARNPSDSVDLSGTKPLGNAFFCPMTEGVVYGEQVMISVRNVVRLRRLSSCPSRLPRVALAVVLAVAAFSGGLASASDRWLTSYETAMKTARETGRPVLTIFTGSDWCPHCRTLEENVLATDTFLDWADDRVVLLMIDLPQQGISQAVRSERSQVCIKYGVRTFPSALLIGPDGQKITVQSGYTGQSPSTWVAQFASHVPAPPAATASVAPASGRVLPSLDSAVETAKTAQRPILLLVSKNGDSKASSRLASLIKDPEFEAFANDHFVVASVPAADQGDSQSDQNLEHLLGGVELGPDAVELIVTDDGQTPLFSQSAAQPPQRLVNGLRRFLMARQAAQNFSPRR